MNINDLNTIEQLEQFLTGTQAVAFLVTGSKDECYRGIQRNQRLSGISVAHLYNLRKSDSVGLQVIPGISFTSVSRIMMRQKQ